MQTAQLGTIELPPVIEKPKKDNRSWRWRPDEGGSSRCPYCLEDLKDVGAEPSPQTLCPICRHGIPVTLLGVALHCLNRPQQWDLLANELHYIWDWEYCDVSSYRDNFSGYWNPDHSENKDRLVLLLTARDAVLRLREEFLEAEGDLDPMITFYLERQHDGEGHLAADLRLGRKWRRRARALSGEGAGPREILEFQLAFVRTLHWGVFGNGDRKLRTIQWLENRLERMD